MTTNHSSNRVILVGTLGASRRGQRDNLPSLDRRNAIGAVVRSFRLQSISAFGSEFLLDLEASPQVEGVELLVREQIGQPLVVEGVIRREVARDRRYATTDESIGERVVTTGIQVTRIREPQTDEAHGSAVWLEGEVAAAPRFSPHRLLPGVQLARTVLRVLVERPSSVPGSRALIAQPIDVSVVVPVEAEHAAALYRVGNRVRVEGQLDITLIPQTANPRAQARLQQLDAEWAAARATLAGSELSLALRRYRNQRAVFVETPLLTVVAGAIELVSGEEVSAEEARLLQERSAAMGRRRRIGLRTPAAAPQEVRQEAAGLPVSEEGVQEAPGEIGEAADQTALDRPAAPMRPRRRSQVEAGVGEGVEAEAVG